MTKILALVKLVVIKRAIRLIFFLSFLFFLYTFCITIQWSVSVNMFGTRLFDISVGGF